MIKKFKSQSKFALLWNFTYLDWISCLEDIFKPSSSHICSGWTKVNPYVHHTSKPKHWYFCPKRLETFNLKLDALKRISLQPIGGLFKNHTNRPSCTPLRLQMVKNFNHVKYVEKTGSGRFNVSKQAVRTVSYYVRKLSTTSLKKAARDLGIFDPDIPNILRKVVNMFLYKVIRVDQLQSQDYSQQVAFPSPCTDNRSSNPDFLRWIVFSIDSVFHISASANTLHTGIFGGHETQVRFKSSDYSARK